MFSHHLQLHKTARDTPTDICGLSSMCGQHSRTGNIVQTRAGGVHEGTTASPAAKYNSWEQVMRVEYSTVNLVKQDSSGWGVYEDFAIRHHYRGCGTGVTNYEDSARQELLPGGEVHEVVTRIMHQIQKF